MFLARSSVFPFHNRSNNNTYREVIDSGLGRLCCLGVEVFGRWSEDPLQIVSALARERTRCLPIRVRRGVELALLQRWWGLLGVSVQRLVAITASRDSGEDGEVLLAAFATKPFADDPNKNVGTLLICCCEWPPTVTLGGDYYEL